jgi:quercetin dioxygenase-like cupin family protein
MRITSGRAAGAPSELRGETFTGRVWVDPVLGAEDEVSVNNVFFEPGARTHWHTHGVGQVLHVTHGRGLLWSSDEGRGVVLEPGDVAHIPAGERHWHGGAPDSYLLHLAISVGPTEWLEPVTDDDYQEALDALA